MNNAAIFVKHEHDLDNLDNLLCFVVSHWFGYLYFFVVTVSTLDFVFIYHDPISGIIGMFLDTFYILRTTKDILVHILQMF